MADEEEKDQRSQDAEQVGAIVAALAVSASVQATASKLAPLLAGVSVPALLPVLALAMSKPLNYGTSSIPSAGALAGSSVVEPAQRAAYVLAASRRVQRALDGGAGQATALATERKYFDQHMHAMGKRRDSATAVDKAARKHGERLGWYAKMDARTSGECKAANGKNFDASKRPPIGFPGSVHPHCRCTAGPPHATSQTVYTVKADAA